MADDVARTIHRQFMMGRARPLARDVTGRQDAGGANRAKSMETARPLARAYVFARRAGGRVGTLCSRGDPRRRGWRATSSESLWERRKASKIDDADASLPRSTTFSRSFWGRRTAIVGCVQHRRTSSAVPSCHSRTPKPIFTSRRNATAQGDGSDVREHVLPITVAATPEGEIVGVAVGVLRRGLQTAR